MVIDKNWTIIELGKELKRLKEEYLFYLAFFSSTIDITIRRKVLNAYIKNIRDQFYALDIKEWQIDRCWEYMNDDISYNDIYYVMNKFEKKEK